MKFLQANLHRSLTADALLSQIMIENSAEVAIISEQYGSKSGLWFEDSSKTAALWVTSSANLHIISDGKVDGCVWINTRSFTILSCYLTPNCSMEEFQVKLNNIEDVARAIGGHLIIAGDFNAKAVEWGMPITNTRGRQILDMIARLGMVIANTGKTPTFRRAGCIGTIPDITLISEEAFHKLNNWKVMEVYTGSDHQYITFCMSDTNRYGDHARKGTRKWNVAKLRIDLLLARIDRMPMNSQDVNDVENVVKETMLHITRACDLSMPRNGRRSKRKAAYWWTEEISQLRRICHRCRRQYTRARRVGTASYQAEEFRQARKNLKSAILRSKKTKWDELRADINNNPWGLGYRLVMRKLGGRIQLPNLSEEMMNRIVQELFPSHDVIREENTSTTEDRPPPLFSLEELTTAVGGVKMRKAPGPDGVPAEVLAVIAKERPQILLRMYNKCLRNGVFPKIWKVQNLVLISKGKGDPQRASSYRPLCLLDTAGKVLERLIKPRLSRAIEEAGGLSNRQYGFRAGKSTICALEEVMESVKVAQEGNSSSRSIVLLVTLDVKNAFNSARWSDILNAMEEKHQVPPYLLRLIRSYLHNRKLMYETENGIRQMQITAGVAQGSILGPELWNIMYDGILRMDMPNGAFLIGYADDIAGVITARNTVEAQRTLNQVMLRTQAWMSNHGLKLAIEKTELLILTKKHIPVEVRMHTQFHTFDTKRSIKYLGILLDSKLKFWPQIHHAVNKAGRATASLSKLMANTGGPTADKRKLLMATTQEILLYGCEIWAHSIQAKHRRKALSSVQRTAALRVASAYRTVSESAVMVISGTIPIDLLVLERERKWRQKNNIEQPMSQQSIRQRTLQTWQQRWQGERYGRWTARLIPNISTWMGRNFGEVNYYLTQFISGHGYFRKYLYRMGKATSPSCIYGDSNEDDAEHTFFECNRWRELRARLEQQTGPLNSDNVIERMIRNENTWNLIAGYVERILRDKKKDLEDG